MAMSDLQVQRGRPPKPSVQAKPIAASATTAKMNRVNEWATPSIPDRTDSLGPWLTDRGSRVERLRGASRTEPPHQCNAECRHSFPRVSRFRSSQTLATPLMRTSEAKGHWQI